MFQVVPEVLSKSLLNQMTNGGVNTPPYLVKEDPDDFHIILNFLCENELEKLDEIHSSYVLARKLFDLYILANKYEITRLMEMIVVRLYTIPRFTEDPVWFFYLAQKIYNETRLESNISFRTYFRQKAPVAIGYLTSELQAKSIENLMIDGGPFAKEMHRFYTREVIKTVYAEDDRVKGKERYGGVSGLGAIIIFQIWKDAANDRNG